MKEHDPEGLLSRLPKVTKKRSMIATAIAFIPTLYLILCILAYGLQDQAIFQPTSKLENDPGDIGLEFEEVWFRTEDEVEIHGWYIPNDGSNLTVLYCHGNSGNIGGYLYSIRVFNEIGLSVFTFDYRGFGNSGGKISEKGFYMDVEAAWEHLTKEIGVETDNIILYGRSLGGPIVSSLMPKFNPAALILESTFTKLDDAADDILWFLPVRLLAKYDLPTIDHIRGTEVPLLVIHSREDRKVRFHHGWDNYRAVDGPREFLELKGDHDECISRDEKLYRGGISEFISNHLST